MEEKQQSEVSDTRKKHDPVEGKKKNIMKDILGTIAYVAVICLVVFLVLQYVGQRTVVNGHSMDPTLAHGENLIMDKISYHFSDPKRFDIVIFPGPEEEGEQYFIKRVIGLPGETVQIIDGKVYKGAHFFAGEFSFIIEKPEEKLRMDSIFGGSCGWSSGLKADLLRRKNLPPDTQMDGHQIFNLINSGDEDACKALKTFCRHLAVQIHNLQTILDPEIFAIGGGISNQPVLMEVLQESLDFIYEDGILPQMPIPKVVRCQNGSQANILGAVYRCRQRMEEM